MICFQNRDCFVARNDAFLKNSTNLVNLINLVKIMVQTITITIQTMTNLEDYFFRRKDTIFFQKKSFIFAANFARLAPA